MANVVYQHARYFSSKGHMVTVVTGFDNARDSKVIDSIKVQEFRVRGGPLITNFYRGDIKKYVQFLQSALNEYNVIFFHGWQTWVTDLLLFTPSKKVKKSKLIFVSHCAPSTKWDSIPQIGRSILLLPYIYIVMPLLMRAFDHIVFLSNKKNGDRHWDHKYADKYVTEKIRVIPNGVPKVPSNSIPSERILRVYNSMSSKNIALYVANYELGKNQKLAIDVIAKLSEQSDLHLVLIGGTYNEYSEKLISIINKKQLKHKVSVLSGLDRNDVFWFYSISYLTLFTSKTECSPLSVMESLAFKKPVVATDVGCLNEWCGVSVCSTENELISEVDLLLNNEKYYLSQKRAISRSKSLISWDAVMRKYDELLLG